MSNIKELEEQIKERELEYNKLQKQLYEIRKLQDETKMKREELVRNAPFSVRVTEIAATNGEPARATLTNEPEIYKYEYVDILKNFSGRSYIGGAENRIPIKFLETFVKQFKAIPNCKLHWNFEAFKAFSCYKAEQELEKKKPHFLVTLVDKETEERFLITKGKGGDTWVIDSIDGVKRKIKGQSVTWTLPLSEGWKIEEKLQPNLRCSDGRKLIVDWSKEARDTVRKWKEKTEKLTQIAEQTTSEVEVHFKGDNKLRMFQNVGVEFIDTANGDAILADVTGLGKTWQAIGYCELKQLHVICVVPAPLKENWRREIKRLTGEDAYVCKGTPSEYDVKWIVGKKQRYVIINYDILGKGTKIEERDKEGKVINHTIRYFWADVLSAANYDQVIFDEAHKIKNTDSNRTKSTLHLHGMHNLFMTATPVLNRPRELYSFLRLLRPNQYTSEADFCHNYMWGDGTVRNVKTLRKSLASLLIRRNRQDVQKDLPPIERIYDWHELSDEAMDRYSLALKGIYATLMEFDKRNDDINITSILAEITRLKQICAQDKVDRIADLAVELVDSEKGEGDGKVVIFSGFKPVCRAIGKRLGHEAVVFDGDDKQEYRQECVDRFQTDSTIKFLVATGFVAGEGLTMTKAGYVIFSDFGWNPAYHQQCEGRVYGRLNEAHGALSYYIVAVNTIEEWIQDLLAKKLNTIEQVIDGVDAEDAGKSLGTALVNKMKDEMKRQRKGK